MSYLVLARKWRPSTFSEVIGQDHVVKTLQNSLMKERSSHAYLFTGPRGIGKTSIARILSKALNCSAAPTAEPCNECESCVDISADRHLDVLEIDGASNRGIDEIRALREKVGYASSRGGKKIYIIDEVHQITRDAFNALLKTLEEPPPNVVFIFATTEPQKVPDTIDSRCQRFDFRRVAFEKVIDQLRKVAEAEKIKIEDAALYHIARKADGSIRDSQSILDQMISYAEEEITVRDTEEVLGIVPQEILIELMRIIKESRTGSVFPFVAELQEKAYDYYDFILEFITFLRNILMVKTSSEYHELKQLPTDILHALRELAGQFSVGDISRILKIVEETERDLRHPVFPRITVESALVRMTGLASTVEISSLISKIGISQPDSGDLPDEQRQPDSQPAESEVKDTRKNPGSLDTVSDERIASSTEKSVVEVESVKHDQPADNRSDITMEKLRSGWENFCDKVGEKNEVLGGFLTQTMIDGVENNCIRILSNPIIFAELSKPGMTTVLEDEIAEFFNAAVSVELSLMGNRRSQTERITAEEDPNHPQARKKIAGKLAEEHPALKKLIKVFDADIVE